MSANSNQCSDKPKTNKQKKIEHIGLLVFWEAIDMVTDWVLYTDVKSIETGLVYGPPDDGLIRALLAFSVIGTLTFVAQVAILLLEFSKNKYEWTKGKKKILNFVIACDLISLITIVLEDFPQAVITLTLVSCREEGISYVQIAKAILPIIEILARIIWFFRENRDDLKDFCNNPECPKPTKLSVALGWVRVIGLIVVFILNLAMLILTTTENDVDIYGNSKSLKVRQFKYIFDEEYNDERYLKTVGIYLHHPMFNYKNSSFKRLLHLTEIYDLEKDYVAEFRILMDAETGSKFIIQKSTCKYPFFKLSECFELFNNDIKIITPCNTLFTTFSTFALRFEFKQRNIPSLLLGDVNYNWKTDIAGYCSQNMGKEVVIPSVHYYRSKPGVNTTHNLNWDKQGARFFHTDELIDVKYIWKTSFSSCQSKGRTSPNLDTQITLNCAS